MANRKGLGVSKKYADGTIHENATGQFMVIDRFTEDDDNIPMLEFQWLTGEKEGKTEVNKEANMAASIHKYQTSRGIPTIVAEPQRIEDNIPFMDKVDMIVHKVDSINEQVEKNRVVINRIGENSEANLDFVHQFFARLQDIESTVVKLSDTMNKQQDTISMLTEQIKRMMDYGKTMANMQEAFLKQQETMNKLIERMPMGGHTG